jgi:hypothetical protein
MENRDQKALPEKMVKYEKKFDRKKAEEFAKKFSKENKKVLEELAKR